jgi:hypothetical protein
MREHLDLYGPSLVGAAIALVVWVALARAMAARGRSRWRPVLLCLPLLLGALGYGLFWFGFFSSPATAVQLHALRLTVQHFGGAVLPWIGAIWLVLSGWLLLPLFRRVA